MVAYPPISDENLRAMCNILGDTTRGLRNTEISILLGDARIKDGDKALAKRDRLYQALKLKQEETKVSNNILDFVKRVMTPQRYISKPEYFEGLKDELNKALGFAGYKVNKMGEVEILGKPTTILDEIEKKIFISYTHKDKELIEVIARKLDGVYVKERVFYDAWSIQPGDSIIGKMTDAITDCRFFFFFVSKNSLVSEMVKLEWEPALIKRAKEGIRFIPVKLDDCLMPQILVQTLYIDVFGQGMEVGVRQIIDVIEGRNTYRPNTGTYENIRGYVKSDGKELMIEFKAETYLEPISRFLILVDCKQEDIGYSVTNESQFGSNFLTDIVLENGIKTNAILVSVHRGTTPGFPVTVKLTPKTERPIKISGLMRAVSESQFRQIPVINV